MNRLSRLENILGSAASLDQVVEATHLALTAMSHRAVLAGAGISPSVFLARKSKTSPASRRFASEILKDLVSEFGPLEKIPKRTLDLYAGVLRETVSRRMKKDLQLDEGLGRRLLEQMRKEDRLATRY